MKWVFSLLLFFKVVTLHAQKDSSLSIRALLVEQLKTTHSAKDWFVPASLAIQGLTAKQANWKDSSDNHSIAQLTTHLIFWNQQLLYKFKGLPPTAFKGNNKETFSAVSESTWNQTVQQLDSVLTAWEGAVEQADEKKLSAWYSTIAHIGTHNAYHTGQILYIRKLNHWWDDNNGVK